MRSPPEELKKRFEWVKSPKRRSEIRGHMETLRTFAESIEHVTEFGVGKFAQSTTAFLMGQPKRMISYDLFRTTCIPELKRMTGRTHWDFFIADTRKVEIEPTDLLFVDTTHVYEHLKQELEKSLDQVLTYVILHDTDKAAKRGWWYFRKENVDLYGEMVSVGDKGRKVFAPGIEKAIEECLLSKGWTSILHAVNDGGLTVFERDSQE